MQHLDEDGCEDCEHGDACLQQSYTSSCHVQGGRCCQELIIEVSLCDAKREPRIEAECSPIDSDVAGVRERIGYLLNDPANHYACHFLDSPTRLCTIYHTRPLVCRVCDCREPIDGPPELFTD